VALVRVYCGLASAPPSAARSSANAWLTVAVVDDAGRLLDVCDMSDDPAGYAELGALLSERSGGTAGVAVATDSEEHQVTLLLAAAGRPLALADEESLDDYAERFGDDESPEEVRAPASERRAVGLARALQAGALAASTQGAPRELMALKPVLAAHAALATGRQGAAVALREVLRELYPAALRAYPDPAEPIPLAILDALPEPGLLATGSTRGRDAAVATQLAEAGVADLETVTEAITALRVAIAETPRRAGIGKTLTTAVAETVRQSVAAVRACDSGVTALVALLAEKATPVPAPNRPLPPRSHTAPAPVPPLRPVREPAEPVARRNRTQPATSPAAPPLRAPEPVAPAAAALPPTAPPRPLVDPEPTRPRTAPPVEPAPYQPAAASYGYGNYPPAIQRSTGETPRLSPDVPPPGSRDDWPLNSNSQGLPLVPQPLVPQPLVPSDPVGYPSTTLPPTVLDRSGRPSDPMPVPQQRDGRVTPPWQADDLPAEPPALRLVEPEPRGRADRGRADRLTEPPRRGERDPLPPADYGRDPLPGPSLRLVESDRGYAEPSYAGNGFNSHTGGHDALDLPLDPSSDEGDGDLLIFAQASAWFTGQGGDDSSVSWSNPADLGWQAAERATRPVLGDETDAGLPRRVPQANLVPGSPLPPATERPLRIVRDPAAMAQHTTGYFRGSRRGEEVRGFAVGGRPGREAAGGWDFSRDGWESEQNQDRGYEYRSAARR
jgi:hypothetical protein